MLEFTIQIEALPYYDLEGRVEVILTDRPRRASHDEPGHGGAVELGTIEQVISRRSNIYEDFWNYAPFPSDALGKLLEQAVREALVGDPDFMARAVAYAVAS